MTPLEAAWEAVLAAPDDDRALQVLADALMETGDPHGELIRLQLSGDEEGAREHIVRHAAELLGEDTYLQLWSPRFSRGFVEDVHVATAAELDAVTARPIGRLLRHVHVRAGMMEPVQRIVSVLARGPRTITSLGFETDAGAEEPGPGTLELAPLTSRLTSLETMSLGSWPLRFEGAASPSLHKLTISLREPVTGLGEARFPGLESLALDLPFRRLDFPLALLGGQVAPKLKTLTISGALWPQQLSDLSVSALLRGLTELEIHAEPQTGWYPALIGTIDSFAQLERLTLVADRHHPEWVQAVRAALPQVIIHEPQLRL
jgi:uncharacterized protein (TIGR02996 family)